MNGMNSIMLGFLSCVFLSLGVACSGQAKELALYQIGNSLTWDSEPEVTKRVLVDEGYNVRLGYHIACGQSLTYMVANPASSCVQPLEPYGHWLNALSSYDWDIVTLQAYTSNATGGSEIEATKTMIRAATANGRNRECIFYLYLAWPKMSLNYSLYEQINADFGGGSDIVRLNQQFLNYWYTGLIREFPELDIRVLPVGIILGQMDIKIKEWPLGGIIDGYSLYRDEHHMSYENGRYIVNSAMLSTFLNKKPSDLKYTSTWIDRINPELVALSNEVVWSVFSKDQRMKIETNPDVIIDLNSLSLMKEIKFTGNLQASENMQEWRDVSVYSPLRLGNDISTMFYRSYVRTP